MNDLISRQSVIDELCDEYCGGWQDCKYYPKCENLKAIQKLPSAQPETCDGCKQLGKWENELEYGYNSPCTSCRRRASDRYAR